MMFFDWNLKFMLPIHFLRTFLANGVLFTNEFREMTKSEAVINQLKTNWSRQITSEALGLADLIGQKGNILRRRESSSDIAASIIYLARKNILKDDCPDGKLQVPEVWPQELQLLTRCTESKASRILVDVMRPSLNQAPALQTRRPSVTGLNQKRSITSEKLNFESKEVKMPASETHKLEHNLSRQALPLLETLGESVFTHSLGVPPHNQRLFSPLHSEEIQQPRRHTQMHILKSNLETNSQALSIGSEKEEKVNLKKFTDKDSFIAKAKALFQKVEQSDNVYGTIPVVSPLPQIVRTVEDNPGQTFTNHLDVSIDRDEP